MMKKVLKRKAIGWSSRIYHALLECGHTETLWGPNAYSQNIAKCRVCSKEKEVKV